MGIICVVSWSYVPEEVKSGSKGMIGIKAEVSGTDELFFGWVAEHLRFLFGITANKDAAGRYLGVLKVANCKVTLAGL